MRWSRSFPQRSLQGRYRYVPSVSYVQFLVAHQAGGDTELRNMITPKPIILAMPGCLPTQPSLHTGGWQATDWLVHMNHFKSLCHYILIMLHPFPVGGEKPKVVPEAKEATAALAGIKRPGQFTADSKVPDPKKKRT